MRQPRRTLAAGIAGLGLIAGLTAARPHPDPDGVIRLQCARP